MSVALRRSNVPTLARAHGKASRARFDRLLQLTFEYSKIDAVMVPMTRARNAGITKANSTAAVPSALDENLRMCRLRLPIAVASS